MCLALFWDCHTQMLIYILLDDSRRTRYGKQRLNKKKDRP